LSEKNKFDFGNKEELQSDDNDEMDEEIGDASL